LCVASNIRAMPENEKPPARRVDVYFIEETLTEHIGYKKERTK